MNLIYKYKQESMGLFGHRHVIEVSKKCKGMPGFAPEYRIVKVGEIVQKFKDDREPYFMPHKDAPNIITADELLELSERTREEFNEDNYAVESSCYDDCEVCDK